MKNSFVGKDYLHYKLYMCAAIYVSYVTSESCNSEFIFQTGGLSNLATIFLLNIKMYNYMLLAIRNIVLIRVTLFSIVPRGRRIVTRTLDIIYKRCEQRFCD